MSSNKQNDLTLCTVNNGNVYRTYTRPLIEKLGLEKVRYTYNPVKAEKAFLTVARAGAADFIREYPETTFTMGDLKAVAADLLIEYTDFINERAEATREKLYMSYDNLAAVLVAVNKQITTTEKAREKLSNELLELPGTPWNKCQDENAKAICAKIKSKEDKLKELKTRRAYLTNNRKIALFREKVPAAIEIWNQYAGKKRGEKTAEKISNEIKEKTGCNMYPAHSYTVTTGFNFYDLATPYHSISFHTRYNNGETPVIDNDNRVCTVNYNDLSISYINSHYIYDIDNAVKNAVAAYENAAKTQKELMNQCSEYMNIYHVDGMPELNYRDTIYHTYTL